MRPPGGGGGPRGPRGGPGGRGEVDPDKPPMNDQLLRMVPNEVRVVISNPESGDDMAGVMPTKAALEKAREMGTSVRKHVRRRGWRLGRCWVNVGGSTGWVDSTLDRIHPFLFGPTGLDLIMISETADPPVVKVSEADTVHIISACLRTSVGRSINRSAGMRTEARRNRRLASTRLNAGDHHRL